MIGRTPGADGRLANRDFPASPVDDADDSNVPLAPVRHRHRERSPVVKSSENDSPSSLTTTRSGVRARASNRNDASTGSAARWTSCLASGDSRAVPTVSGRYHAGAPPVPSDPSAPEVVLGKHRLEGPVEASSPDGVPTRRRCLRSMSRCRRRFRPQHWPRTWRT